MVFLNLPDLYRLAVVHCFEEGLEGPQVNALRVASKMFRNGVYLQSPEMEKAIREALDGKV